MKEEINMYKIKANEKLFDEIKELTRRMNLNLPSIIQNDMEISKERYNEFFDEYEKCINYLDDWMIKIKDHIKSTNK